MKERKRDGLDVTLESYVSQLKDFQERLQRHGVPGYNEGNYRERLDMLLFDMLFSNLFTDLRTTRLANEFTQLNSKLLANGFPPKIALKAAAALLCSSDISLSDVEDPIE